MAEIRKLEAVLAALRKRYAKAQKDEGTSVVVGYTANYAVYVHENLQAVHGAAFNAKYSAEIDRGVEHSRGPNQQAKFLEQPARELKQEFQRIIAVALRGGHTIGEALLLCGLRLQRESQRLVPVDTGNLRASAFTRVERK